MNAARSLSRLNGRHLPGVRFVVDPFTPHDAGDDKFNDVRIPGHSHRRLESQCRALRARGRGNSVGAARRASRFVQVTPRTFDERFGSTEAREAITRGMDPDTALARQQPRVDTFPSRAERFGSIVEVRCGAFGDVDEPIRRQPASSPITDFRNPIDARSTALFFPRYSSEPRPSRRADRVRPKYERRRPRRAQ